MFDPRLTYADHISLLKTTGHTTFSDQNTYTRMRYGAERWSLLLEYRWLDRPCPDYACDAHGSAWESIAGHLSSMYHGKVCIATGAFCTTPVSNRLVKAGVAHLMILYHQLRMQYYCKISQSTETPSYSAINCHHLTERQRYHSTRLFQFVSINQ